MRREILQAVTTLFALLHLHNVPTQLTEDVHKALKALTDYLRQHK